MPGANCFIFECIQSRTTKGLALFDIPKKDDELDRDWGEKLVNIITKERDIDANLRGQIEKKSLPTVNFTLLKIRLFVVSSSITFLYTMPI